MLLIIFQCLSVLWFILFSGSSKCDTLLTYVNDDSRIQKVSACISRRLPKDPTTQFETHYNHCSDTEQFPPLTEIEKDRWSVELLCRNNTNLVFRVAGFQQHENETETRGNNEGYILPIIIVLKVYKSGERLSKQRAYLTNDSNIIVGNLDENSNYTVSVTAVSGDNIVARLMNDTEFYTLPNNYQPGNVTDITLVNFLPDEDNNNRLKAQITWRPAEDMTCFYDVLSFSVEKATSIPHQEIRQPDELYTCVIHGVFIGSTFRVAIRGVNEYRDELIESYPNFIEFATPSCLKWYDNNLTICSPHKPTGLQAQHTHIIDNLYTVNVSWDKPELFPDYYRINMLGLDWKAPREATRLFYNVSGYQTSQLFEGIKLQGFGYEIYLTAYSIGGNSSTMIGKSIDVLDITKKHYARKLLPAMMIPIVVIVGSALLCVFVCHRRAKLRRHQQRCKYFEDLEKQAPVDPNPNFEFPMKSLSSMTSKDHWNLLQQQLENKLYINDFMEIDRENIILLNEILGEGAFGLVRKGIAKLHDGRECDVAVKMLKGNPSINDVKEFRREIDVMKSVGEHPNIVGILGHCTKNITEMLLLTEYCSRGNLLHYLRTEWHLHQIKHLIRDTTNDFPTPKGEKQPQSFFNVDTSHVEHNNKIEINGCKCILRMLELGSPIAIENQGYYKLLGPKVLDKLAYSSRDAIKEDESNDRLTSADLLRMAKQIALGMEFLSKNRVVHRDLAARNVLVSDNRDVKIADFGLSRDVYQENIYKKTGNGKLPIKWLALESMTHQVYTSQSDVWSYGILLYEIVTLGGTPYPMIPTEGFIKRLKSGYRMEKPKNCSNGLYDLMRSCWRTTPTERPTFSEICTALDDLLAHATEDEIINLTKMEPTTKRSKSSSEESYLKLV